MNDQIEMRGITAIGYHGVLPHERTTGQPFVVDIDLDLVEPAVGDQLSATVDYSAIVTSTVALITGEPVNLIETLAGAIADACLEHDRVAAVEVVVHKPAAPVGAVVGDVAVRIRRVAPPRED